MSKNNGQASKIQPVILSGGAGTRLWPLSRTLYPKQLMPLNSEFSMFQETVRRVRDTERFAPPLVVCNTEHRFIVAEQLREIEAPPSTIVIEPEGRNTAPAAAVAALLSAEQEPDRLLLLMPADHVVRHAGGFLAALEKGEKAARRGALVTFGLKPERPETGYGYIRQGRKLARAPGCYRVARFVEKPDRPTAERLVREGDCYWNSGMFLVGAACYLSELERLQPDVLAACRAAVAGGCREVDFFRLDEDGFRAAPAISIDYAVMERTDLAAVVPADMGWSDVGSWSTLWEIGEKDTNGNVTVGDVVLEGVRNCYIQSNDHLVAAVGLEDVVIVVTDDAVLASARDQAQRVRTLVDGLKAAGRSEANAHSTVYRPWGHYRILRAGERFQVKQITVKPGAKLSLQKHRHRAEHWVVVGGTARVTRGEEILTLRENQSTSIRLGQVHRLENPGQVPLEVIEVQLGDYLGEDDIVRIEDSYGRAS